MKSFNKKSEIFSIQIFEIFGAARRVCRFVTLRGSVVSRLMSHWFGLREFVDAKKNDLKNPNFEKVYKLLKIL